MSLLNGAFTALELICEILKCPYTLNYSNKKKRYTIRIVGINFDNEDKLELITEVYKYFMENNKTVRENVKRLAIFGNNHVVETRPDTPISEKE